MLINGQADIAILLDFIKPSDEFKFLIEEEIPLGFFAAENSTLLNRIITAEELTNQKFVASGFGVTFLPEIVAKNNQWIKSVQITGECKKVYLQVLVHKNKWKNAALNEFIKMCSLAVENM